MTSTVSTMLSHRRPQALPAAVALTWVAYFAVLQWSVVRFRVPIVVVLTLCTLALAWWQWARPTATTLTARSAALALLLSAVVTATVPMFSYLPAPGPARWSAASRWRRTWWVRERRSSATRRRGSTSG